MANNSKPVKNTDDTENIMEKNGMDDSAGEEQCTNDENTDIINEEKIKTLERRVEELEKSLEDITRQAEEYKDLLQRKVAEFDNYKKRTMREKAAICDDITCEVVNRFIPVVDNLERALEVLSKEEGGPLKEGVEMVYRQTKDILSGLGVREIEAVGKTFDPELHNAVAHINDDNYGENEVIEEFQKGYILGDKVIRHSAVKVAN